MARIGPMTVNAGNNKYQFVVYDLKGPEYNAPGVYIFSKGTPNDPDHEYLYIGETHAFRERLNPHHEKWEEARRLGMDYIFVHVPFPVESRRRIEMQLIQHFQPPLNEQFIS